MQRKIVILLLALVVVFVFCGAASAANVSGATKISAIPAKDLVVNTVTSPSKSVKGSHIGVPNTVNALNPAGNGNFVVGELIIPRLGVNCQIRSDTVNAYNAAYHYSQSASFGQPGECGIMSHRTTYSALFRNLPSLRIGDKVTIINLMKTKYTYSVTSNGKDIRWDYKTNPIKFTHSGTARLFLVTCYPLGYEKAAFITHCKLISTDYIPRILSTTPQNMKTNMSRTSTIIIKFSEKIKKNKYYNYIKVKNLKTNKYVTISKIIHVNAIYIKTASKRSANTWYQVIIPKAAIKDYTSNNLVATYTFKFKTKTIPITAKASLKSGLYNTNKIVTLSMSEAGTIFYTLKGSTPTKTSTKYTGPITISKTTILKFLALDLAGNRSPVYTQTYKIDKIPPKVAKTIPTNKKINISRISAIVIKFSENIKNGTYFNKITIKNLTTGKTMVLTKAIKGTTLSIKTTKRTANTWYQVTIPKAAIKDYAGSKLQANYSFKFKTGS